MIKHILKKEDFTNVIKSGKKYADKELTIYIKTLEDRKKDLYIGLIIPKRIVRLSTRRNYIKRTIYAEMRLAENNITPGRAIVVKYCKNLEEKSKKSFAASLKEKINKLFKEAGLYREENNN